jgi:hypothetical protein
LLADAAGIAQYRTKLSKAGIEIDLHTGVRMMSVDDYFLLSETLDPSIHHFKRGNDHGNAGHRSLVRHARAREEADAIVDALKERFASRWRRYDRPLWSRLGIG